MAKLEEAILGKDKEMKERDEKIKQALNNEIPVAKLSSILFKKYMNFIQS